MMLYGGSLRSFTKPPPFSTLAHAQKFNEGIWFILLGHFLRIMRDRWIITLSQRSDMRNITSTLILRVLRGCCFVLLLHNKGWRVYQSVSQDKKHKLFPLPALLSIFHSTYMTACLVKFKLPPMPASLPVCLSLPASLHEHISANLPTIPYLSAVFWIWIHLIRMQTQAFWQIRIRVPDTGFLWPKFIKNWS